MEKTSPSNFVSIDANTTSIAFAVWENDNLSYVGKIVWNGKTNYEKVADASRKLSAAFSTIAKTDTVVIEHTVFMNSPKTAADLALVQGAILGALTVAGVKEIKSINPIAWQTFIKNGRLTTPEKQIIRNEFPGKSDAWYKNKEREFRKQRTIKFVSDRYKRKVSDNDIADAIGIGHYAIFNWEKLG
jgi:Holliday junction resolvasome RuvABC endonuclease subunit